MENKEYILFGAGEYGKKVIKKIGYENIRYIIDNDEKKQGTSIEGIEIISFDEYLKMEEKYPVLIGSDEIHRYEMEQQLKKNGICNYRFVWFPFCHHDVLVENAYDTVPDKTEDEWNDAVAHSGMQERVNTYVNAVKADVPLFNNIEIETINRCNGTCSFCPVNKFKDIREEKIMDIGLFEKIIAQLEDLNYSGRLALFSNDEPLLDERIIELSKYAREHLPYAQIHMFSNGTLFTLQKFIALLPYLDELIIDNYSKKLQLIKPCREIKEYVEAHPEIQKKVVIILRKPNEILTSRGGDAPNRKNMVSYEHAACALPFQQLVVRPDGKVSLCCNDPYGKCTLGDLNQQSILEVWYGPQYNMLRKCIAEGRSQWDHCRNCDTFMLF